MTLSKFRFATSLWTQSIDWFDGLSLWIASMDWVYVLLTYILTRSIFRFKRIFCIQWVKDSKTQNCLWQKLKNDFGKSFKDEVSYILRIRKKKEKFGKSKIDSLNLTDVKNILTKGTRNWHFNSNIKQIVEVKIRKERIKKYNSGKIYELHDIRKL